MAYVTDFSAARPVSGFVSRLWVSLTEARSAQLGIERRRRQMAALEVLSDEQLAARGLRRADIARHVFSDLILC